MILVIEWAVQRSTLCGMHSIPHPNLQQAIVGAVLNKTNMDHLAQYDVQHKSMYKNRYYARYAYLDTN